ncbi:MAG: zf-HC2 domain-containing protein [Candidatus Krumholzibacteria bacterium]|nr:zf-HC2 domain-containing protein [Candidatus Krumholzibacteria bacterium]
MSRSTPTINDDHLWGRRQLAAAAVGLLPDTDEERLQAHLSACGECRESWNEQVRALAGEGEEADPAGERHLPAAMIARWPLALRTLNGRERDAVHSHLERCGDCRADLAELGHRPELTVVQTAPRQARSRRSFGAGMTWGVGVTALAAVIAGLVIMPTTPDPTNTLLPWVAPVTMRSGNVATLELTAGATGFTILASVPTDMDARRAATVAIFGPSGAELMSAVVTPELQAARTISLVISDGHGIAGGDYRVVFTQSTGTGSDLARESTFRVNLQSGD